MDKTRRNNRLPNSVPIWIYCWFHHGRSIGRRLTIANDSWGVEAFSQAHVYKTTSTDAEILLYVNSTKFTWLSTLWRLMNLKATNGRTDKNFIKLMVLLNEMFPDWNTLSTCNYETKKIICPLDMEYKRIHVCPNNCILYKK